MSVNDHQGLDALCAARGIVTAYHDIYGTLHHPAIEVKLSLLGALGSRVETDADIYRHLEQLGTSQRFISPVLVWRQSDSPHRLSLTLKPDQEVKPVSWTLYEESGSVRHGRWEVEPTNMHGEHHPGDSRAKQFEVELPADLECGYHQLEIAAGTNTWEQATLIIAPETCYQPPALDGNKKLWGICLQLYSLRSKRNWGIGDLSDLNTAVEILAPLGVDIIGLNPLHSLFLHQPERASPYSPSSRDFLNPIYLDVEAIEEFGQSQELQVRVKSDEFQLGLKRLREQERIHYAEVWARKLVILKLLYTDFRRRHVETNSPRAQEFCDFKNSGGQELLNFARFEALQNHFYNADKNCFSWKQWPPEFQDPESDDVAGWAETHTGEIEFHLYLQWNSERQFSAIQGRCLGRGMAIGIYRDLAVGITKSAAQSWAEQSQYAMEVSIGAPPDDFNSLGQNWDLPPPKPQTLCSQNYHAFAATLRANMRHSGALRIDHIMGLMRLYWIPPDCSPDRGTYVSYPFDDLLAILALESQRNRCLIVGEDLGTVPDEVRHALWLNKILSYRIFCFEKNWHEGSFKAPGEYPRHALCTAGSHDLPTLMAYWRESDIDLREQLDLFPSSDFQHQMRQTRKRDRIEIIAALQREGLDTTGGGESEGEAGTLSSELALSIQRYLARSNAALMTIQLEDLFLQENQVNLPGTVDQYPNWRSKLSLDLEDWLYHSQLESYAQAINHDRGSDRG